MYILIRYAILADGLNQDVGRVHGVAHLANRVLMLVGQRHRHRDRAFGERHIVGTLESPLNVLRLLVQLPFLKQRAERRGVEPLPRQLVSDDELPVATERRLREPSLASSPSRLLVELFQIDFLPCGISRKDVVDAQRVVLKPSVEILR